MDDFELNFIWKFYLYLTTLINYPPWVLYIIMFVSYISFASNISYVQYLLHQCSGFGYVFHCKCYLSDRQLQQRCHSSGVQWVTTFAHLLGCIRKICPAHSHFSRADFSPTSATGIMERSVVYLTVSIRIKLKEVIT